MWEFLIGSWIGGDVREPQYIVCYISVWVWKEGEFTLAEVEYPPTLPLWQKGMIKQARRTKVCSCFGKYLGKRHKLFEISLKALLWRLNLVPDLESLKQLETLCGRMLMCCIQASKKSFPLCDRLVTFILWARAVDVPFNERDFNIKVICARVERFLCSAWIWMYKSVINCNFF